MIVNEPGIVLRRSNFMEADRLCVIYTEKLGKISVRFVGVNKPGRKMKALSEPVVWAEYRLYLSARGDLVKAVGGQIISSFPELRDDLGGIISAMGCCERLDALTPAHAPSAEKYLLITSTLAVIEEKISPWAPVAFGLHLLELVGYSLRERRVPLEERELWRRLHETAIDALEVVPWRAEAAGRFALIVDDQIEAIIGKPLKSRGFHEKLAAVPVSVPV